jgi:Raf kinase inhibitor-like YbhB/YbcL family protein
MFDSTPTTEFAAPSGLCHPPGMRRTITFGLLAVTLAAGLACSGSSSSATTGDTDPQPKGSSDMKLESPAFAAGASIPTKFTCEGEDISPALRWSGVPEGTKSLALIVDDPDAPDPKAPKRTWVHWVLYDIPPTATELPEAVRPDALPAGTREGNNDWKRTGYGGPCPPIGEHRYFHKLYALDVELGDLGQPNARELAQAMQNHVLARAELIGTYEKER